MEIFADLFPLLVIGLVVGSIYSIAATGLVLTYRTSGIFNFAHGAVGMFAAFFFAWLVQRVRLPVWLAAIVSVAGMAPLMGVALDRVIFRPLREAATVVKIVVTIGLLVALQGLAATLWGRSGLFAQQIFPTTSYRITGRLSISADQIGIVSVGVFVSLVLWLVIRHTRFGVAMRAVVDRPDLAELMGESSALISSAAWALGSALAALAGVLLTPQVSLEVFILTFLVINAYSAAMLGRLESLPLTFAGGIVLGVGETLVGRYAPRSVSSSLVASLSVILLFALLIVPRRTPLREPREAAASAPPKPLGAALAGEAVARPLHPLLRRAGLSTLVAVAILGPLALSARWIFVLDTSLAYSMTFLSLVILVGYGGQISLGQAALAGVGGVVVAHLMRGAGLPFLVALPIAGLAAVPVGALLAFPALRLHGLFLALATMAFGLLMEKAVFVRTSVTGGTTGLSVPRPSWLASDYRFCYVLLGVFALLAWGARNLRRGKWGRVLAAMRDSEVAARSIGVSMTQVKIAVFSMAAFVAAVGGASRVLVFQRVASDDFIALFSLVFLAVAVIGGISSWVGALIGGFVYAFVPPLVSLAGVQVLDDLVPVAFGLGAIALAQNPHGIMTEPRRVWGALRRAMDRASGRFEEATRVEEAPVAPTTR